MRLSNGRFRFAPQFGPFGRTAGMLFTSAVTAAVVGGVAFGIGALAPTLFVGFVSSGSSAKPSFLTKSQQTRG